MNSGNQLPNLDKIFRADDEMDFLPSRGSNLAAIFGTQVKSVDSHSSSKQQVAKKSNSHLYPTQTVPNKPEIIIAKAVHAFKLQNGVYVPVGKLGMALVGSITTKVYQIILYKTKQEHVSTVTVTCDFLYTVQPNNYSSYYDSNKENWSILFENNDVCVEFAKEIGLARYFSKDRKLENVLHQDLSPVNKDVVATEGDNVSIKYFVTSEITQPFKGNFTALQTMTVDISTDDNWEKTLVGSSKGLKRILFLPPSKQISLGPGFPKEKDVLLEIEIIDIHAREEITHVHKTTSDKASIISRMAKMGQSMFPKTPTNITTDSEDTEDDIPHKSPRYKKMESSEGGTQKKYSLHDSTHEKTKNIHGALQPRGDAPITNISCKPFVSSSAFTSQWSSTQIQPNFVTLDGQVYSLQPQTVTPTVSSVIDPGLNMLLSETRMTNAEVRMGISKIADNVQKLLDKFHVLELQNATSPIKDTTVLDAALKMLLTMNASQTGEKDNELRKTSDISVTDNHVEVDEMKSTVTTLKKELEESKEYIKKLEVQKESLTQINESLNKNVQELEISLKDTNSVLAITKKDLEAAKEFSRNYEKENVMLEDRITKLQEKCNALTSDVSVENESKNREIKHIMNQIYYMLLDKFVDESYPTNYIKSTIANVIKNATLQILYNTNERSNRETESAKATESDATKIANAELKNSDSNTSADQSLKQTGVTGNTNVSLPLLQDEPPPIPANDIVDDINWLN
ncbi:FK506-binding protein 15-like isoform X1 [Hylaeus volcanicus]|uniref:FK506-binding protein 15-like isoform X1 n=1 Tax=Hylaeus volcanicus TaxID=313075 RepID=UPI0023B84441|nr:FK506-binding protein 15-like isoform X1 [Hylaeus volcanicus]